MPRNPNSKLADLPAILATHQRLQIQRLCTRRVNE